MFACIKRHIYIVLILFHTVWNIWADTYIQKNVLGRKNINLAVFSPLFLAKKSIEHAQKKLYYTARIPSTNRLWHFENPDQISQLIFIGWKRLKIFSNTLFSKNTKSVYSFQNLKDFFPKSLLLLFLIVNYCHSLALPVTLCVVVSSRRC